MIGRLSLVTAPTGVVVTPSEALAFMSLPDDSPQASVVDSMLREATEAAEDYTGRQLLTATWDLYLDYFPAVIRLPKAPVQSVTSITYTDTQGDSQTWSSSEYKTDLVSAPPRITPAYSYTYPDTYPETNVVVVRFVAGYGAASAVPDTLKEAVKAHAAWSFRMRDEGFDPFGVESRELIKTKAFETRLAHYKVYGAAA